MGYKVIIFTEAKEDIREAAIWYNKKEKGLGNRFIASIKSEVVTIKKNPLLYEARYDNTRVALTAKFPYLIHFDVHQNTIFIKAVFHTSRNSDAWIER